MRITKFIHSCLLFEAGGDKMLFDPGTFTFVEGLVKPEQFGDLQTIVFTHGHPDHLDMKATKHVLEMSHARVIASEEVANQLRAEGIEATIALEGQEIRAGAFTLLPIDAKHEPILADKLPQNTAFLIDGKILNTGDSMDAVLHRYSNIELLLTPVMAPYLNELAVYEFVKRMKPRALLPIHDGYVRDFFRKLRYENFEKYFKEEGVKLHSLLQPGDSLEIQ